MSTAVPTWVETAKGNGKGEAAPPVLFGIPSLSSAKRLGQELQDRPVEKVRIIHVGEVPRTGNRDESSRRQGLGHPLGGRLEFFFIPISHDDEGRHPDLMEPVLRRRIREDDIGASTPAWSR